MNLTPYLFFNGRCEEALRFYQQAIGAEPGMLMRFRENPDPPTEPLPAGWGDKVMHAELRIGAMRLFLSDAMSDGNARFEGFSLVLNLPEPTAARRVFDALAVGGEVRMPMMQTFWSPLFGMLVDRFGVGWMVGVEPPA